VATPLDWEELGDGDLGAQTYTIGGLLLAEKAGHLARRFGIYLSAGLAPS
jgi:hypothetical protein